jgi:hypothetical protein
VHPHRHLFKILVEVQIDTEDVDHVDDRQLEFFTLQETIERRYKAMFDNSCYVRPLEASCERLAEQLLDDLLRSQEITSLARVMVEVSEDGENAGRCYYKP